MVDDIQTILSKEYTDYTFLSPQISPRAAIEDIGKLVKDKRAIDETKPLEFVINGAEDEMYIALVCKHVKKGIKDILPNFRAEDYKWINYHYISHNGTEESILSLTTKDRTSIDIGKIKKGDKVSYQLKIGEEPTLNLTKEELEKKAIATGTNLSPVVIFEAVETYLRKEVPRYFELQTQR